MNSNVLYNQISSALGDPSQTVYPLTSLQQAAMRAIHAYSQYRPIQRQIGTGNLVQSSAAHDQVIYVVGGYFNIGDTLYIDNDPPLPTAESAIVMDVELANDLTEISELPTVPITMLTFTTALKYAHKQNAMIQQQWPGITTQNNQAYYNLPFDFKSVNQTSFDEAVGLKLYWNAEPAFYDASEVYSDLLSGVGWGSSQNFYSGFYYSGYAFNGPPGLNVLGVPGANGQFQQDTCHRGWRFFVQDMPMLWFRPTPTQSNTYRFQYNGCHTVLSAPTADMEIVVAYACYAALMARAAQMNEVGGSTGDSKVENFDQSVSRNVTALKALACEHLEYFNRRLTQVPVMISG